MTVLMAALAFAAVALALLLAALELWLGGSPPDPPGSVRLSVCVCDGHQAFCVDQMLYQCDACGGVRQKKPGEG